MQSLTMARFCCKVVDAEIHGNLQWSPLPFSFFINLCGFSMISSDMHVTIYNMISSTKFQTKVITCATLDPRSSRHADNLTFGVLGNIYVEASRTAVTILWGWEHIRHIETILLASSFQALSLRYWDQIARG